jgi:hypothetical protein
VSNSHYYLKGLSGRVGGGRDAFETRDFYLACFLRCAGYELRGLRAEGSRRVFVFKDRSRHEDVMAYYGEAVSVRPLAFASTIKDMKALLHNA